MWLFSRPLFLVIMALLIGSWYVWGVGAVIIVSVIAFIGLHLYGR